MQAAALPCTLDVVTGMVAEYAVHALLHAKRLVTQRGLHNAGLKSGFADTAHFIRARNPRSKITYPALT